MDSIEGVKMPRIKKQTAMLKNKMIEELLRVHIPQIIKDLEKSEELDGDAYELGHIHEAGAVIIKALIRRKS